MNLQPVLRFLGRLVLVLAAAQIFPLVCSILYGEGNATVAFFASAVCSAALGGVLIGLGRGDGQLYRREGILIVVLGWVLASTLGALPYLLSGALGSPVDALFESASGFTTTGSTVFLDIAGQERGILFWRSFTQWLGGMGIIVLFVALLPEIGPGANFLYKLEVPGPTAEGLSPRIHDTAAVLWRLYLGLTLVQTVVLMLLGMGLYDALTHTFSTLSSGGFSPRNESVAAFEGTPAIALVIILFMVLAGGNFSLYYGIRQGRGWNLLRDPEFRLYLTILGGASLAIAWQLLASGTYEAPGRAAVDSAFQVVSVMTTTGFATADFEGWPAFSKVLLVGLMFVGGCAGSTAGSMKVMRMVIGLKSAMREVRYTFRPNTMAAVFVGGKAVPDPIVRSVAGFFVLFITCWGLGTILLTLDGHSLLTSATAAIATLGNVGPGLEMVGPVENFAFFSDWAKLVMILLMWVGRLEVYAIAALFHLRFWKG
ncbi:MAG: TrkH family potassium uptake protein [Deltaproteobacteria bacterium]|nr:TrkH family potassium uptake protein [Deltaproteobacteria bacterium]